jgi:hypothetical protein
MLFLRPPTTTADIREFTRQFREGIRVEYKSVFDESVRRSTAKMVSALANTLGGVAVIGVDTDNGVPREPIVGFDMPNDELRLVIEQICLQGINPPIIPRITQIDSDSPGKCFLVIEVEESLEAPHAIENKRQVYVRTGNAAMPYDLAQVDVVIERFTRRRESQARRLELVARQTRRYASYQGAGTPPTVEASVGPTFPSRPLIDRASVWEFCSTQTYREGRFIPREAIRRTNDGVAGPVDHGGGYVDISQYGFVLWKNIAELEEFRPPTHPPSFFLQFRALFQTLLKALVCSSRMYGAIAYRGPIQIDVSMDNCYRQSMPFLPDWNREFRLDDFRSVEHNITAQTTANAETLERDLEQVLIRLLTEVCWSFWQSTEAFYETAFATYVRHSLGLMGIR